MLTYVSTGIRDFGRSPVLPQVRRSWEFYAVLRGEIAPLLERNDALELESSCLWLFPPTYPHGWKGNPAKRARVAVFHFDEIPAELDKFVREDPAGYKKVPLTREEAESLYRLAKDLITKKGNGGSVFHFHTERALIDLTLIFLEKRGEPAVDQWLPDSEDARVEVAEDWFRTHLSERPSIKTLAKVAGVSEGHLRCLFQRKRGCSTRDALFRIQMERALELLVCTKDKLDIIADACGFSDASSFCRGFRRVIGKTPLEYRKTVGAKAAGFLPGSAAGRDKKSDRPEETTNFNGPDSPQVNGDNGKASVDRAHGQSGLWA